MCCACRGLHQIDAVASKFAAVLLQSLIFCQIKSTTCCCWSERAVSAAQKPTFIRTNYNRSFLFFFILNPIYAIRTLNLALTSLSSESKSQIKSTALYLKFHTRYQEFNKKPAVLCIILYTSRIYSFEGWCRASICFNKLIKSCTSWNRICVYISTPPPLPPNTHFNYTVQH